MLTNCLCIWQMKRPSTYMIYNNKIHAHSDIFYQGNNYHFVLNISTGTYQSLAQSFNKHWHDQIIKDLLNFYLL